MLKIEDNVLDSNEHIETPENKEILLKKEELCKEIFDVVGKIPLEHDKDENGFHVREGDVTSATGIKYSIYTIDGIGTSMGPHTGDEVRVECVRDGRLMGFMAERYHAFEDKQSLHIGISRKPPYANHSNETISWITENPASTIQESNEVHVNIMPVEGKDPLAECKSMIEDLKTIEV